MTLDLDESLSTGTIIDGGAEVCPCTSKLKSKTVASIESSLVNDSGQSSAMSMSDVDLYWCGHSSTCSKAIRNPMGNPIPGTLRLTASEKFNLIQSQ